MKENDFQFFLNWYEKENERRYNLENSLNIPIGLQTVLFALLFFLFKEFEPIKDTFLVAIFFYILVLISSIFLIVSVYFLLNSYLNPFKTYTYKDLDYASSIWKWRVDLEEYYLMHKEANPDLKSDRDFFEKGMIESLVICLDVNVKNNDEKTKNLHLSKRFIFLALLPCVISIFPFCPNYLSKEDKYEKIIQQQVEIQVKLDSNLVSISKILHEMAEKDKKPTTPPPPPPPPPKPRDVREGLERPNPTPPHGKEKR